MSRLSFSQSSCSLFTFVRARAFDAAERRGAVCIVSCAFPLQCQTFRRTRTRQRSSLDRDRQRASDLCRENPLGAFQDHDIHVNDAEYDWQSLIDGRSGSICRRLDDCDRTKCVSTLLKQSSSSRIIVSFDENICKPWK